MHKLPPSLRTEVPRTDGSAQEKRMCILTVARLHSRADGVSMEAIVAANSRANHASRCGQGDCKWIHYRIKPYKRARTCVICKRCFAIHVCLGWSTCERYQQVTDCNSTICSITGVEIAQGYSTMFSDQERTTMQGGSYGTKKRNHFETEEEELEKAHYDYDDFPDPDETSAKKRTKTVHSDEIDPEYEAWIKSAERDESAGRSGWVKEKRDAPDTSGEKKLRKQVEDAIRKNGAHLNISSIISSPKACEELSLSITSFLMQLRSMGYHQKKGNIDEDVIATLYLLSQGMTNALAGVKIIPQIKELGCITKIKEINHRQKKNKKNKEKGLPLVDVIQMSSNKIKDTRKTIAALVTSNSEQPEYNNTSLLFPKLSCFTVI